MMTEHEEKWRELVAQSKVDPDLIWITEAIVKYRKSRGWFQARLDDNRLHTYPQPGTAKVYLSKREIEARLAYEAQLDKGARG